MLTISQLSQTKPIQLPTIMYRPKYTIPTAILSVAAFAITFVAFLKTNAFGITPSFFIGALAFLFNVASMWDKEEKASLFFGIPSFIVAGLQIAAVTTLCSDQDDANVQCVTMLYRKALSIAAAFWILAGILNIASTIRPPTTRAAVADASKQVVDPEAASQTNATAGSEDASGMTTIELTDGDCIV
jgi:hypothetical protein